MIVTDIKDYKKGKYEIYLNDLFAFILYKSELKQFKVEKDSELSSESYDLIMKEVLPKRAKKRAMNLLLKNDMTERKLRDKLNDNHYPAECIDEAIEYVKNYNYIDDSRYAKCYIEAKASSMSKMNIRNKLIEKGVSKVVADAAIQSFYEFDPLNNNAEEELIKKLLLKKCSNLKALDYSEKQKLFAFLYRKGFSIDKIEKVYDYLT